MRNQKKIDDQLLMPLMHLFTAKNHARISKYYFLGSNNGRKNFRMIGFLSHDQIEDLFRMPKGFLTHKPHKETHCYGTED
jgi:hypothetical protein